MSNGAHAEAGVLLWSHDVAAIADWAVASLGLTESWRAPNDQGVVEHCELQWFSGRISINIKAPAYAHMGPSGISLRVDDRAVVDALYRQAQSSNANITVPLAETPVAYSFTATDPDGNQWWVHAETGFLDQLRDAN